MGALMAKRKSNPGQWFVTQHEFKQMLYIIARELNEAKARITALEGAPASLSAVMPGDDSYIAEPPRV
jgi:hypothetical protein